MDFLNFCHSDHHSDHSIFGRIGFQSLARRGTVVSVGLRRFVRFVSCYLFVFSHEEVQDILKGKF